MNFDIKDKNLEDYLIKKYTKVLKLESQIKNVYVQSSTKHDDTTQILDTIKDRAVNVLRKHIPINTDNSYEICDILVKAMYFLMYLIEHRIRIGELWRPSPKVVSCLQEYTNFCNLDKKAKIEHMNNIAQNTQMCVKDSRVNLLKFYKPMSISYKS